jgi:hypothetical protein
VNKVQKPGRYEVVWDGKDNKGSDVASGVYFYRIQSVDLVDCKKMLLIR